MENFEGPVNGVASFYDFPGTALVPVLAGKCRGLRYC